MKLYLARHGHAVSSSVAPQRPLSDQGRADIRKVAASLEPLQISVEHIWHSGKLRARQTAEFLSEAVHSANAPQARTGLSPNDSTQDLAIELEAYNADLMIVSHLPFVGILASLLTTGRQTTNPFDFTAGSIACLTRKNPTRWQIEWFISPDSAP